MARRTTGEALQDLFADRDRGRVTEAEFQRRKAYLLRASGGCLSAMEPDRVGTVAKLVAITGAAALVVLAVAGAGS